MTTTTVPAPVAAFCHALGLTPETTAAVTRIRWGTTSFDGITITLGDCAAFNTACAALHVKTTDRTTRLVGGHNTHRVSEAVTCDHDVFLEHLCWSHLDCWEDAS